MGQALQGQVTCTAVWPGSDTVITPFQRQLSVEVLLKAGEPATCTVDAPGVQGEAVAGTQGIGVSTAFAAAVAEATTGLAKLWHMPKGAMFMNGTKSWMVPAGLPPAVAIFGVALKTDGAVPIEQAIRAPVQVCVAMRPLLYSVERRRDCRRRRRPVDNFHLRLRLEER